MSLILSGINQLNRSAMGAWRHLLPGLVAFSKKAVEYYSSVWLTAAPKSAALLS
jgi:hypothetical protein